jgi:hypothetical protein
MSGPVNRMSHFENSAACVAHAPVLRQVRLCIIAKSFYSLFPSDRL